MYKDYVIIGAGSIGLAIAFRLKQTHPSRSILVLDTNESGTASLASGAMLGCFGEVTKYTLSNPANKKKFDLMYEAHSIWPQWMDEIKSTSNSTVNHTKGTYVILNTHGGALDDDNFDAMLAALDQYQEPYENVSPGSIPGLNPNSLARPLRAVYLNNEGSIESAQYLKVLQDACLRTGVEFKNIGELHAIERNGELYSINFDDQQLSASSTIVAAGAYSDEVLNKTTPAIKHLPILSGNGVAAVTKRHVGDGFKATVRTANRAGSCGLHIVPMSDGNEYIGATNVLQTQPETRMTVGLSHFLSQCAIEQLDLNIYHSYVESWRVGNRPVSLDTMPVIGRLDEYGLYVATGTYRDGLHCSPVIASALVDLMDGKKSPIVEPFTPQRQFTQLMSKDESIREYAMQALSGAYENWYRPAYYMNDDDVMKNAIKTAEAIYSELDTDIGLHPDILLLLSSDHDAVSKVKKYLDTIKLEAK